MTAITALTVITALAALAIDAHERRRAADRRRHEETTRLLQRRYGANDVRRVADQNRNPSPVTRRTEQESNQR